MARDNSKEIADKEVAKIRKSAEVFEGYFVGLLWKNVENFNDYSDYITSDYFLHDVWKFYYQLGYEMWKNNVRTFDTVTVNKFVEQMGLREEFEKFNGFETIEDVINIVSDGEENIEFYYDNIVKTKTIKQLYELFGSKVLLKNNKYDFEQMSSDLLLTYWNDKVNQLSVSNIHNYESENLIMDEDEFLRRLKEDADEMIPFYKSPLLQSITSGIPKNHLTFFGSYSGLGKTSFLCDKVIYSAIVYRVKTLLVLNEESEMAFRQKMVLTILNHEFNTQIQRKNFVTGNLTEEEEKLVRKAFVRMRELTEGDDAIVKLAYLEKYIVSDLEKIVKYHMARGVKLVAIDTHKVEDNAPSDLRWVSFVESAKKLYKMARKTSKKDGVAMWINLQLADSTIKNRYLTYDALAEGKSARDVASIFWMMRSAFSDELEGGKKELQCFELEKNKLTGKWEKKPFTLSRDKNWVLLFTVKNRMGLGQENGQNVLVMESALHRNHFREKGWTTVLKDF